MLPPELVSTRQPLGDSGWPKGRYSWNHSLHFLISAFIAFWIIFIWVWLWAHMSHGVSVDNSEELILNFHPDMGILFLLFCVPQVSPSSTFKVKLPSPLPILLLECWGYRTELFGGFWALNWSFYPLSHLSGLLSWLLNVIWFQLGHSHLASGYTVEPWDNSLRHSNSVFFSYEFLLLFSPPHFVASLCLFMSGIKRKFL